MEEDYWFAIRVAALLDVELLAVTHVHHSGVVGFDRRIEIPLRGDVQLRGGKGHGNLLWS
ncbi:hypothetical protein PA08_1174 [Cutibacterium modestum P08]|jgi:hypothetical protein|uniref:Uncharacterized protein n=1 Tax=Cutibacterium modestum HL044PA1 TaxID=765109 RepID=A0ABN0C490_9ACTN|nr:hypothetical protein HMPREF9607_02040 [Cutibacterium modestum HL044PA1]EGG26937.1 hypothetical protein PA08_1174 [Cutibacterium modestum P08]